MTATITRKAHKYELVGRTFSYPGDCTVRGYIVEYSARSQRTRVRYHTAWQGERCYTWYLDGQTKRQAEELLDDLQHIGEVELYGTALIISELQGWDKADGRIS